MVIVKWTRKYEKILLPDIFCENISYTLRLLKMFYKIMPFLCVETPSQYP